MTTLHITNAVADKYLKALDSGEAIDGDPSFRATLDAGREFALRDSKLGGFVLRMRASSKPVYIYIYRTAATAENPKRRQTKIKIGRPSTKFTAETARKAAAALQSKVEQALDPVAEKRGYVATGERTLAYAVPFFVGFREKQHKAGGLTLQNWKTECLHLGAPAAERTDREPQYFEVLHDVPLTMIKTSDVQHVLEDIAEEHGPACAVKARRTLSQFFDFCGTRSPAIGAANFMPENLINPVKRAANPAKDHDAEEGAVLTGRELGAVLRNCNYSSGDFGAIVQLLAYTGKRRCEIAKLRWSEIDFEAGEFTIPKERSKNGKPDAVPMSPQVVAILRSVEERKGRQRDLLFGRAVAGFSNFSKPKKALDRWVRRELPEVQDWNLHHLRHTLRSTLANAELFDPTKLPISENVLEKLLNHKLRGIAGVYNKHLYLGERRTLLNAWANYLDRHVDPSSVVVQLRRA